MFWTCCMLQKFGGCFQGSNHISMWPAWTLPEIWRDLHPWVSDYYTSAQWYAIYEPSSHSISVCQSLEYPICYRPESAVREQSHLLLKPRVAVRRVSAVDSALSDLRYRPAASDPSSVFSVRVALWLWTGHYRGQCHFGKCWTGSREVAGCCLWARLKQHSCNVAWQMLLVHGLEVILFFPCD